MDDKTPMDHKLSLKVALSYSKGVKEFTQLRNLSLADLHSQTTESDCSMKFFASQFLLGIRFIHILLPLFGDYNGEHISNTKVDFGLMPGLLS